MKQQWTLDPFDGSVSKELRDYIFEHIQNGEMSNGSYTKFWSEWWDEHKPIADYAKQYVEDGTEFLLLIHW